MQNKFYFRSQILRLLFVILATTGNFSVYASPYPDAGTLFREHQDDSFGKLPPSMKKYEPTEIKKPPADIVEDADKLLLVTGYEVHGNTKLTKDVIEQTLLPYTNVKLSTAGIHRAADTLREAYVANGYFAAEVLIPPQAITANVVALHVYEGVLATDGVHTINTGERVKDGLIHDILRTNLHFGEVMNTAEFERSISLIGDLPGISIRSTLYPGKETGTANLLVETSDTSLLSGNVYADNFGSYYTGEERLGATLNVNSPAKAGDLLSLGALTSGSQSNYGFMQYEHPLNGSGARMGIRGDHLNYSLEKEFESHDAHGNATEVRLYGKYPFIRSRHTNTQGRIDLVNLKLNDKNDVISSAKREINSLVLNVRGDHDDDRWGNGELHYSVGLTYGDVTIKGGRLYQDFDTLNTKTEGSFSKIELYLARLQHLSGPLSTFVAISGQIASKNLDTSQKFYLGGPHTVAGYPAGEMSGDDGALLYADLRYDFFDLPWGGNMQLALFYSQGSAKLHHEPWPDWMGSNTQIENKITLKSIGISAHQTWADRFVVHLLAGHQLGDNIGSDPVTGEDSDHSTSDYRLWIQGIYYF